jgi:hypothetical protein
MLLNTSTVSIRRDAHNRELRAGGGFDVNHRSIRHVRRDEEERESEPLEGLAQHYCDPHASQVGARLHRITYPSGVEIYIIVMTCMRASERL